MQAVIEPFRELVQGRKQFVIPVFQRDYSWTPEQCAQLWHDVHRVGDDDGSNKHFMGSIVCVDTGRAGTAFGSWLVIDGQQRLTTLLLLLAALRDRIQELNKDDALAGDIEDDFLTNPREKDDRRYKLLLRQPDDGVLRALLDRDAPDETAGSQAILEAYNWFTEQLTDCDQELIRRIYRGINSLEIADMKLDERDHPQLIFESLNSTGVDLAQSDLVRNYILLDLKEHEQTRLYERYWLKIENSFRSASGRLDHFLRDYVFLKSLAPKPSSVNQPRADRIYEAFKEFKRNQEVDLEDLLKDIERFSKYYLALLEPSAKRGGLAEAMRHVRSLGTTHIVLGMKLYDHHANGELSKEEFADALRLIESYLVRRGVCGLESRSYSNVFADIARSLEQSNVLVSLRVAFAIRRYYYFPGDDVFRRELLECRLYERKNMCWHVLTRMENDGQREPSPLSDLSIEHIMPQITPERPAWQKMLGDDWEDVYEKWLHRLGNLTLTAYNSSLSAREFTEKKQIDGGFNESAVRLNAFVREQDVWTANEMGKRARRLSRIALRIWPSHAATADQRRAAEMKDLRERAKLRGSTSLKMSQSVRKLLGKAERVVAGLGDVVRIVERKSVCCYMPDFFVEIMPRAYYLRFILPLNLEEVDVPIGLDAQDTTTFTFVPNRVHRECNMLVDVYSEEEIGAVMSLVRHAYDQMNEQA